MIDNEKILETTFLCLKQFFANYDQLNQLKQAYELIANTTVKQNDFELVEELKCEDKFFYFFQSKADCQKWLTFNFAFQNASTIIAI